VTRECRATGVGRSGVEESPWDGASAPTVAGASTTGEPAGGTWPVARAALGQVALAAAGPHVQHVGYAELG
jgi:hypothetical protein